jgi:carbon storage regulator
MLVLTRKVQEAVVVGGRGGFTTLLRVTVLEIVGNRVRLGFEADADVPVHRQEVWERKQGAEPGAERTAIDRGGIHGPQG